MTEQQAIRMALAAMEKNQYAVADTAPHRDVMNYNKAITALRQALEPQMRPATRAEKIVKPGVYEVKVEQQPADEPVAMNWSVFNTGAEVWDKLSLADAVVELTPARLERGWSAVCVINKDNPPLYTRPQPAAWVGLTDEELKPLCDVNHIIFGAYTLDFVRAIEAKLKEKNA